MFKRHAIKHLPHLTDEEPEIVTSCKTSGNLHILCNKGQNCTYIKEEQMFPLQCAVLPSVCENVMFQKAIEY